MHHSCPVKDTTTAAFLCSRHSFLVWWCTLLAQVIDALLSHPVLGHHLKAPSVSLGAVNLYAHGIFEEETRPNLGRIMSDLVPEQPGGVILTVNDKKLHAPMRVHLKYSSASENGQAPMS
jgi:hypothetical protein